MRYTRDQSEFDRAIAFIDATFALALTLLVMSLDITDRAKAFASFSSLSEEVGPQFITFVIAFAVIASYWLQHHQMVASWVAIDVRTIVVNLLLIAGIILLPFSTAAVGDPSVVGLPLPTALMAVNIAFVSIVYTVVWLAAAGGGLMDPPPDAGTRLESVIGGLAPAVVFLVSIPIAYLVAPEIAQLLWVALLVVNPLVPRLTARLRRPKDRT